MRRACFVANEYQTKAGARACRTHKLRPFWTNRYHTTTHTKFNCNLSWVHMEQDALKAAGKNWFRLKFPEKFHIVPRKANTNSQRRNQPIQLRLQCWHQCTPQWTRYWPHDLLVRFQQLVLIVFLVCKFLFPAVSTGFRTPYWQRSATEYSSTCHPSPFPPFAECIITDCK
jgi:hypothetical protein